MSNTLITPEDKSYDKLRLGYNKLYDIYYPFGIALVEDNEEILDIMKYAINNNIELGSRSGDHSYINSSLCNGIVIDQRKRKDEIYLNVEDKILTVRSGVLIGDLLKKITSHNFLMGLGTCPGTGIAGLTLGAGLGFSTRLLGYTLDSLLEAEIILFDGYELKTVITDKNHFPDLFWAIKGACANNFGIVTQFKYQLYHIESITMFEITYDLSSYIYKQWQDWILLDIPNELGTEFKSTRDGITLTGQYIVIINDEELKKIIEPLINFSKNFR